jgi:NADH:ubiquinone oxidoreductase subunit F (NADH-binding)/(2Fe-2S) ferredoxin/Pyruvate/2-oxoacid:ferredoxin oxidoreductase delta subunit
MNRIGTATELKEKKESILASRDPSQPWISVCGGTGCLALGAEQVGDAFREELEKQGLKAKVSMALTGCPGFCERGPLVVIYPEAIFYERVKPEDVSEIVSQTVLEGKVIDRLLHEDPSTGQKVIHEYEVPFYKEQERMIMADNGRLDPASIDDYIALGGYSAVVKALTEMTPEEIIETVKRSGLRGRGGAGFPTGRKWESCRRAQGDGRYVICNADEGDPGAFVDRSLLEGNPHSILEGMIIGAYAVGANEGIIYVRNEYPLAVHYAGIAIQQARDYGLLGENILGSGFDFDIRINRGAGAFVCGESSALMRSLEGLAGEPRAKHVHATEKGLWDKPTVLNNVKSWATIRHIINNGADWFTQIGTERSTGTMVFSLVGKINNTGLVEVPMGITLRELIYDIGGGIPGDKKFKAIQTGGPSGGCIPESLLDLPVDYDSLTESGSMMGSGGMIVMDEETCMVDVARYFLAFNREESCGKCTACREGIRRMHFVLDEITHGRGREGDIEMLEELGQAMQDASLCALGRMAPNPVLTTLRYFHDEYEAHIRDKRCPAGVCTDLIRYSIIDENCTGCEVCRRNCPAEAISGEKQKVHVIDQEKCIRCGICREVCKFDAVGVE